jgi:hypothetical protein
VKTWLQNDLYPLNLLYRAKRLDRHFQDERRRNSRAEIKCPIVILASSTLIDGETLNLSLGGALIRCSEQPNPDHHFRMVIESSKGRLVLVKAERIWSNTYNSNGNTVFRSMGVRFLEVFDDRKLLFNVISGFIK